MPWGRAAGRESQSTGNRRRASRVPGCTQRRAARGRGKQLSLLKDLLLRAFRAAAISTIFPSGLLSAEQPFLHPSIPPCGCPGLPRRDAQQQAPTGRWCPYSTKQGASPSQRCPLWGNTGRKPSHTIPKSPDQILPWMPGSLRQQGCNFEGVTYNIAHQAAVQCICIFFSLMFIGNRFLMSKAPQL